MTDFGTSPPPPPPPPPGGSAPPPGYWLASDGNWYPPQQWAPAQPVRTNGMAIASLVLGIIWIYWIGSLLAVVFGHVALRQIDRSDGQEGGRGMAVAGLVLGYVGMVLGALALAAVVAVSTLGTTESSSFSTTGSEIGGGFDEPLLSEREQFLLQDDCRQGDMAACDELYDGTPVGSTLEEFAATCGNRFTHWDHAGACAEQGG